jgi:orsellinic acid C2-O-methyltransferase
MTTKSDELGGLTATLMPLITGFMPSRALHVAAGLGIADLLAEGAKTSAALALETGTHQLSLHRLLRTLASVNVVDEIEPGLFALTALGAQLRKDVPGSVRNLALMFGAQRIWRTWGELDHCVRTGEPATQRALGMGPFEYLAAHPREAEIFNEAMAEITRQVARAIVPAYDFAQFHTIVDVGGGNGALMTAILSAAPKARGIVFDSPSGSAEAPSKLAAAGLADRCEVLAGDFFRSVPKGADAYILKSVIHDWDDERSTTILKNCREAISADGKLLLIERVMPARVVASASHQRWANIDMHMLVMLGGRERTEPEFEVLLSATGFKVLRVFSLPGPTGFSLIEAIPS